LEELVHDVRRDAWAGISNADHCQAPFFLVDRDGQFAPLGVLHRLDGVADQVQDHLLDLDLVGEDELDAGYRMLEAYLRKPGPDPLTDLAVDYARVFLGAGVTRNGGAAYPYESVYTSPARLVMQDARDRVLAAYRAKGLDKVATFDVPEDHIGLELEFMACLCKETREAVSRGDWPAVAACLTEQRDFLESHLANWVPEFCGDVMKYATTEFFQAVARLTNGFLRLDGEIIASLMPESEPLPA
jgi:anaerobic sulfite reductase subunit A